MREEKVSGDWRGEPDPADLFCSSRRRHTIVDCDWSSDVCSSDLYPTLQMLDDEGLVRSTEREGKRVYDITDEGREESTRRLDEAGGPPWAHGYGNLWGEAKLLQIGRGSWRERGEISVGAVSIKKK